MGRRLEAWRKETKEGYAGLAWFVFFAMVLAGPGLLAYQAYRWLRWGAWHTISVRDWLEWASFGTPRVGWVGVQRIIDFLLSLPLWLVTPAVGILLLWLFFWGPEDRRRERERAATFSNS
ncbi:MAG TPA: hypothetical protein VF759_17580 [Allosphingosinicella sp.]|jgi:hypothetical protein